MDRALTIFLGLVGAVVLAVAVAAAVLATRDASDPIRPFTTFEAIDHDPAAARNFVEAWQRWRTATFVSEGTWTRTIDGVAEPLTGAVYTAQDPPRRTVIRLGALIEQVDGSVAACSPSTDEIVAPPCVAGEGLGYNDQTAIELALVGGYVTGDNRLYDVGPGEPGCFRAEQIVNVLASPWGRWAEFCFDPLSGALASARVRRPSAVDVEQISIIRTDVSDADFG